MNSLEDIRGNPTVPHTNGHATSNGLILRLKTVLSDDKGASRYNHGHLPHRAHGEVNRPTPQSSEYLLSALRRRFQLFQIPDSPDVAILVEASSFLQPGSL
jgi:hypothetical protein